MQIATFVNYIASGGDDQPNLQTLCDAMGGPLGVGGVIMLSGACKLNSPLRITSSRTKLMAQRNSDGTAGASITAGVAQMVDGATVADMITLGDVAITTVTFSQGAGNAATITVASGGHRFLRNDDSYYIVAATGGTYPTGLAADTLYYLVNATATYSAGVATTTAQLSLTKGGAAVVISDAGSGASGLFAIVRTYFQPSDVAISSDGTNPSSALLHGQTIPEGTVCILDAMQSTTLPAGLTTYKQPAVVVIHYNANGRAQFYPARGGPAIAITGTGTAGKWFVVQPCTVETEIEGVDLIGLLATGTDYQSGLIRTATGAHLCRVSHCNITGNNDNATATQTTSGFSSPVAILGNSNTIEFCRVSNMLVTSNVGSGGIYLNNCEGAIIRYCSFDATWTQADLDLGNGQVDINVSAACKNAVVQHCTKTGTGLTALLNVDVSATNPVSTPNP